MKAFYLAAAPNIMTLCTIGYHTVLYRIPNRIGAVLTNPWNNAWQKENCVNLITTTNKVISAAPFSSTLFGRSWFDRSMKFHTHLALLYNTTCLQKNVSMSKMLAHHWIRDGPANGVRWDARLHNENKLGHFQRKSVMTGLTSPWARRPSSAVNPPPPPPPSLRRPQWKRVHVPDTILNYNQQL